MNHEVKISLNHHRMLRKWWLFPYIEVKVWTLTREHALDSTHTHRINLCYLNHYLLFIVVPHIPPYSDLHWTLPFHSSTQAERIMFSQWKVVIEKIWKRQAAETSIAIAIEEVKLIWQRNKLSLYGLFNLLNRSGKTFSARAKNPGWISIMRLQVRTQILKYLLLSINLFY